ncbi:MAG TPA: TlpA disulfide reductase family protein [Longimicrobiales bacterium]
MVSIRSMLLIGAAAALVSVPATARAQDVGLALGARPKPVVLSDLNGRSIDLGQYIGKRPVLLEFWATWCPLCRALEPQLASVKKRSGGKLSIFVVAVGVNQNPRSIKRHLEKHPAPGVVLWDEDGAAVRAFEAPGTSYVVLLDARGKVVYTGSGSEQKLLAIMSKALP